MKYLITITLIALSINAFSMNKYIVCTEQQVKDNILKTPIEPRLPRLTRCVNDNMEKGYVPLSGLHATPINNGTIFFQSLVYKGKKK
mgnify:CR=1 FL=1